MHAVSIQKCSIPFFISAIFLWSNAVCFCRTISLWNIKCSFKRYTMPFGGVQCAFNFHLGGPFQRKSCYFHMSNLPFKGAVSLLEKPILLHNMQYFWHRASLSKVQYVLKCEILSEYSFAPYNRALSFMATQSSFEKAAFVETWITFHWYMYLIGTRPLSGRGVFVINGVSWMMFDVVVPIGFWLMWFQRRKTRDSGA